MLFIIWKAMWTEAIGNHLHLEILCIHAQLIKVHGKQLPGNQQFLSEVWSVLVAINLQFTARLYYVVMEDLEFFQLVSTDLCVGMRVCNCAWIANAIQKS